MIKGIILGIVLKEIITTVVYYVTGESEEKALLYTSPITVFLMGVVGIVDYHKRKALDKKIEKDFISKKDNPDFDYTEWVKEILEKYHKNVALWNNPVYREWAKSIREEK